MPLSCSFDSILINQYNTVQIGDLANETLFFTIILMFIGTAPGSCGGGVKITTFSSIMILGVSRL
ncbi:MAG: hypothetical protein KKE44_15125 [Proteobacteria bacterium]|nr:hypothetical protein [Pseudomonadota bacterium]MBU1584060.1 hypothetical protein [Pseudomonadota bacterium]MBU2454423.1 hypothetical protein [Pseudomonadota bacterium]MBU2628888.1 hypothetical protein [Pseudomonadota bacterium]